MVTEEDVRAAYRLFLDREPESPELVASQAKTIGSMRELRERFASSAEFRGLQGLPQFMPPGASPLDVQIEASPAQLAAMVRHVEASWRRLGEIEPHFSVIVSDAYRAERIAETESEFYQTGRAILDELRGTAERCGIDLGRYLRCFELGAGVGRVSVWLAGLFETLVAADISAPHLALARAAAERFGRANIGFLHLGSGAELAAAAEFDVFISMIVLQHDPPPIIARLLRESGCELLARHDDGATGGYMISNTILARKRLEAASGGDEPRRPSRWWRR